MAKLLEHVLDAFFGHPRGLPGRIGGAIMARGNAEQEREAIERLAPSAGHHLLVVGHGPGVGLALAADRVGPTGQVIGVDPSATMRQLAAERCTAAVAAGVVDIRDGSAEHTGCADQSIDAVVSVNNVMLWDRQAGLAEAYRVLRPHGQLTITVHRHVLNTSPQQLTDDVERAGFVDVSLHVRPRRMNSPAVDLVARRAVPPVDQRAQPDRRKQRSQYEPGVPRTACAAHSESHPPPGEPAAVRCGRIRRCQPGTRHIFACEGSGRWKYLTV
ncbi:methyltransferase domain-containing protein [Micromonospora sp. NPDC050686]|uniref:class I SAM-dependent methyltransferase n=1 Tax=Micromonospora sp. NPDC050686 TaxID=3154631 RepID=UPI0033C4B6E6